MAASFPQATACLGDVSLPLPAPLNAAGTCDEEKDVEDTYATSDRGGGAGFCCLLLSFPSLLSISCCFKNLPTEAGGKGSLAAAV